jgi:hypothetical protein
VRLRERLFDRGRNADAARIRVLDDHTRRELEFAQQPPRRREIVQVVEGELASVDLLHPREQVAPRAVLGVVGRPLMRVLAVGDVGDLREAGNELLRERLAAEEPGRDRRFVGGRRRKRLGGKLAAGLVRQRSVLAQLGEDLRVPLRPAHRCHMREVLGRAAEQRRPADVDQLDRVLLGNAVARHDLRERVKADADKVERPDVVLVERGEVVRAIAPRQDRRVDAGMQRLDAAAEQLGDLRQLLDAGRLDAALRKELGGSPAGDELDIELGEPSRELLEAGLVPDREQRSLDHEIRERTVSGSRRCSTAWTRARSVSTVSSSSTGTRSATITGPVSIPSST